MVSKKEWKKRCKGLVEILDEALTKVEELERGRHSIVIENPSVVASSVLDQEAINEVIRHDCPTDRFVLATIDSGGTELRLVNGDFNSITVPLSVFTKSGCGLEPDFKRLEIRDYGQTIAFGEYEASSDFIIFEANKAKREKAWKEHPGL